MPSLLPYIDNGAPLIFLLCHGHIGNNEGKRYIGQTDYPLSPTGARQAQIWRSIFQTIHLSRIITSDLQRTLETARVIRHDRPVPLSVLPALREIALGEWEDQPFDYIRQRYPAEFNQRGRRMAVYRPPGGESFQDLDQRVWNCLTDLFRRQTGNWLIVSHAGVNRVILARVLGLPLDNIFSFRQDYGGLNILSNHASRLNVLSLNILPDLTFTLEPRVNRTLDGRRGLYGCELGNADSGYRLTGRQQHTL